MYISMYIYIHLCIYIYIYYSHFCQGDLRHHKAMLLDNYNELYLWVGPQCNAVVQRMAVSLAQDYIRQVLI